MSSAVACTLAVRAVPNAPRTEIIGWMGRELKVKVHAPALENRANEALCEFMADHLSLPKRAVTVRIGQLGRQKVLDIQGITTAELRQRLPPGYPAT